MKFGILISDLTADQARSVLNELGGVQAPGSTLAGSIRMISEDAEGDESGAPATGDFDSAGLPWDERIHAGSKTQNKDGTWKKRKGVQPVEIQTVEAELRARVQTPAAPVVATAVAAPMVSEPAPVAPPVPQAPVAPAAPVAAPTAPAAPVAPPAPTPAPVAAPVAIARDFQGLLLQISNLYKTQQVVDPLYPNTIVSRINAGFNSNITSLPEIAANADMVNYAWQCLDVDGKAN